MDRLNQVALFLEHRAAQGDTFLFVGTKTQAAQLIAETAQSCNSSYVNTRWLGGTLTNWATIRNSLGKLSQARASEKRGEWDLLKKQEASQKRREKDRLEKYLGGLEKMYTLPDLVIIIGQREEIHAVNECRQLGIPIVTILDTNCDPSFADWFVPANDDSISSLRFLLNTFQQAILKGQASSQKKSQAAQQHQHVEILKPTRNPDELSSKPFQTS